jgi:hypothetical protein
MEWSDYLSMFLNSCPSPHKGSYVRAPFYEIALYILSQKVRFYSSRKNSSSFLNLPTEGLKLSSSREKEFGLEETYNKPASPR